MMMTEHSIAMEVENEKTPHTACKNAAEYRFLIGETSSASPDASDANNVQRLNTRSLRGFACARCAYEIMNAAERAGRTVRLERINIETTCTIDVPVE